VAKGDFQYWRKFDSIQHAKATIPFSAIGGKHKLG